MTAKKKEAEPSFEKALERLEKIVEDMESGELSLEKMIAEFEEGQKLVTFCQGRLNSVERKIEQLVNADGSTKAFDEEEPAGAEGDAQTNEGEGGTTLF